MIKYKWISETKLFLLTLHGSSFFPRDTLYRYILKTKWEIYVEIENEKKKEQIEVNNIYYKRYENTYNNIFVVVVTLCI